MIALDVIDSSDSLQNLCTKCGTAFTTTDAIKMCNGNCQPRKAFHLKCIAEGQRNDIHYCCQYCNPSTQETSCYKHGLAAQGDIIHCTT